MTSSIPSLKAALRTRPAGRRPAIGDDPDPGWVIEVVDDGIGSGADAASLALTDGCLGTQTFSEVGPRPSGADQAVRTAGIYGPERPGRLMSGPTWTPTGWPGRSHSWSLDLRAAVVTHRIVTPGGAMVETRRWAVAGEPGSQALVVPATLLADLGAEPEPGGPIVLHGAHGRVAVVAVADVMTERAWLRVACARQGTDRVAAGAAAAAAARTLADLGPDELVERQHRRWADRWHQVSVRIAGDPDAELRTRFVLYHLLALTDHHPGGELAWGARGLTGEAYGGHVFWDTDVFVLPALATVAPRTARAQLAYRVNRLDAARALARADGAAGARFPWESAATGADVTPERGTTPTGETVPITNGEHELHISADVVWAFDAYHRWTGDGSIWADGGAETAVEVARWWTWRLVADPAGPGHLSGVTGPDEYHEDVDDNAFTNLMVAWCLDRAAAIVADGRWPTTGADAAEARQWRALADGLADGFDPVSRRHRQFDGYDRLAPMLAASIADPPFPADLLLGADTVRRSQIIKQADVLQAHQLIPGRLPVGSLEADVAHYLPRTSHGSSLSPAVHAEVLARAGRADEALTWLRTALGVDLDDLTGTGTGGLHYATLAGAWQALLGGFLGLRPTRAGLVVAPRLPSAWSEVEVRCRFQGAPLRVRVDRHRVEVDTDRALIAGVTRRGWAAGRAGGATGVPGPPPDGAPGGPIAGGGAR